jgi:hypothetical protein
VYVYICVSVCWGVVARARSCVHTLRPTPTNTKYQFRAVGVNFAPGQPYLSKVKEATKDIDVQVLFNNAGCVVLDSLVWFGCVVVWGWVGRSTRRPGWDCRLTCHQYLIYTCTHRYIVTGFFDSQPLEKQLANVECNATAAVALTHHFVGDLIKARDTLFIVFVCICMYVCVWCSRIPSRHVGIGFHVGVG